jgi:hypothetical protein
VKELRGESLSLGPSALSAVNISTEISQHEFGGYADQKRISSDVNFKINFTTICHRNQRFIFAIHIHIIHEKFRVNRDDPRKNSALTEINHETFCVT